MSSPKPHMRRRLPPLGKDGRSPPRGAFAVEKDPQRTPDAYHTIFRRVQLSGDDSDSDHDDDRGAVVISSPMKTWPPIDMSGSMMSVDASSDGERKVYRLMRTAPFSNDKSSGSHDDDVHHDDARNGAGGDVLDSLEYTASSSVRDTASPTSGTSSSNSGTSSSSVSFKSTATVYPYYRIEMKNNRACLMRGHSSSSHDHDIIMPGADDDDDDRGSRVLQRAQKLPSSFDVSNHKEPASSSEPAVHLMQGLEIPPEWTQSSSALAQSSSAFAAVGKRNLSGEEQEMGPEKSRPRLLHNEGSTRQRDGRPTRVHPRSSIERNKDRATKDELSASMTNLALDGRARQTPAPVTPPHIIRPVSGGGSSSVFSTPTRQTITASKEGNFGTPTRQGIKHHSSFKVLQPTLISPPHITRRPRSTPWEGVQMSYDDKINQIPIVISKSDSSSNSDLFDPLGPTDRRPEKNPSPSEPPFKKKTSPPSSRSSTPSSQYCTFDSTSLTTDFMGQVIDFFSMSCCDSTVNHHKKKDRRNSGAIQPWTNAMMRSLQQQCGGHMVC